MMFIIWNNAWEQFSCVQLPKRIKNKCFQIKMWEKIFIFKIKSE